MIIYKTAENPDVERLARIRVEFLSIMNDVLSEDDKNELYGQCIKYFNEELNKTCFAYFAMDGGQIVSVACLSIYRLPPRATCRDTKVGYISNVYTIPSYRKQGIGTKVFTLIVEKAKDLGHKCLYLHASDMGRPIYEKFGFVDSENEMVYHIN